MPLSVLAGDINLSTEMTAVKAVTYSNSAKMGLAMKRRFWEEDQISVGTSTQSPARRFRILERLLEKGVLLGLYANGPVGNLIDQPVSARIEHVLTHASKVHPQIRKEFESAYAVWWRKVKYSQGGYATGSASARRAQLSKVDNRVIIGSAVTAPKSEPDWQEGAVSAAWQALTSLHERAMRT
jgi:monoamine oxidase